MPKQFGSLLDVIFIEYRGIVYRPRSGRMQYYVCGTGCERDSRYLHRQVWIDHNGPISEGYDVHHQNGDINDNRIENLECLPCGDHRRCHISVENQNPEIVRRRLAGLANAREAAKEWHGSDAGLEWHRQNGRHVGELLRRRMVYKNCECCGGRFKAHFSTDRFCSLKCISLARYRSGVDNETRVCECCGEEFSINKYFKTTCCSRSCGKRAADRRKAARLQSEGGRPTGVLRRRIQTVPSA